MNGRVYDYNVGRFMSVDPVIQSPGNSQSINPYSYIMNNPLAGTDPTGYVSELQLHALRELGELEGTTVAEVDSIVSESIMNAISAVDTASDLVNPVKGGIKTGVKKLTQSIRQAIKENKNKDLQNNKPAPKNQENNGAEVKPSNDARNTPNTEIKGEAQKARKQRNKPPSELPEAEGRPHSIVEKSGPSGQYTTHNGDGTFKQFRGEGKPHGNIERPNVKENKINETPKGEKFISKPTVRKPRPSEIPGSAKQARVGTSEVTENTGTRVKSRFKEKDK